MCMRSPRSQPVRRLLPLSLLAAAAACERVDPCPHTTACPAPTVCQPDGTCRPAPSEDTPPGVQHRVATLDWATEHGDGTPAPEGDVDLLPLGGPQDAIVHLAFGPLPSDVHRVTEAIATLSPHPSWPGSRRPWRVAVLAGKNPSRVRALHRPRLEWTPEVHVVRMRTGARRPLRIDVTPLVRDAAGEGRDRVHIALRLLDRHAEALIFASPRAQDVALRPHLDIRAR